MGKTPYQKMKLIFTLMEEADIVDIQGNFLRKQEWFWPKLIHDRLLQKIGYNLDRTNIKDILETCCDNEQKFVEKRTAEIEPIAKFEYRLTDSGKEYLKQMNDPNYLFNKLNK